MNERINVTRAFLPPRKEYDAYLDTIWSNNYLTNQGPLLISFEDEVSAYLGVNNFHFVSNGTIALQVALKSLGIEDGEVITTPFSYVATTSSILWEHCTPVYVDINPTDLCIDVKKIEAAITPNTKAIMPVHVFGIACNVVEIERIAEKYDLKVIYDAAHAFGVEVDDKSILIHGDISTCSFHATKLFHTIEGGGIVVNDDAVSKKVELIKRFGHNGDEHSMLGINAKTSEFSAAMGLTNLKHIDSIIGRRKTLYDLYVKLLNEKFYIPAPSKNQKYNYAYMPVLFRDEEELKTCFAKLEKENIYPRRYFYPSLNKLPYLENQQACPISEDIAVRIACMPLYDTLDTDVVEKICSILNDEHDA